jgi:hypothetical protein
MIDHRDLVIADLADREAELLDRIASLEHETEIYRSLAASVLAYNYHVIKYGHDDAYRNHQAGYIRFPKHWRVGVLDRMLGAGQQETPR